VSSPVRPDAKAFEELEALVRNLGEELATFRKRAHAAEARLKAIATKGGGGDAHAEERVAQLEAETTKLRQRLAAAAGRTRKMLDRVRFLRQQHSGETR
jgi:predicted  nucleic acid-binding Zn-ribbon protein